MEIVDLEMAKRLKKEGFKKPTHHFYTDKDLPFYPRGLKSCKNDDIMNHNRYDDWTYSAPTVEEAIAWLHGKGMEYPSSVTIKLDSNK